MGRTRADFWWHERKAATKANEALGVQKSDRSNACNACGRKGATWGCRAVTCERVAAGAFTISSTLLRLPNSSGLNSDGAAEACPLLVLDSPPKRALLLPFPSQRHLADSRRQL